MYVFVCLGTIAQFVFWLLPVVETWWLDMLILIWQLPIMGTFPIGITTETD